MGTRASLALLLLSAFVLGACGPTYQVLRQSDATAPLHGGALTITPLQFQVTPPESPQEWAEHTTAWDAAYFEALTDRVKNLGVTSVLRQPAGESPQGSPTDGAIIVATVREILRGNFMSGDHIIADIQILDAATNQPRLTATLKVNSLGSGPEGYTFGGRIKLASVNLAESIASALARGTFPH